VQFSNDAKLFLGQLKGDPKYRLVMKELKQLRPVVPAYKPQETRDSEAQLIEQIKYSTALQQGFDNLYRALTGERNE
jgi:hypothetical protein